MIYISDLTDKFLKTGVLENMFITVLLQRMRYDPRFATHFPLK